MRPAERRRLTLLSTYFLVPAFAVWFRTGHLTGLFLVTLLIVSVHLVTSSVSLQFTATSLTFRVLTHTTTVPFDQIRTAQYYVYWPDPATRRPYRLRLLTHHGSWRTLNVSLFADDEIDWLLSHVQAHVPHYHELDYFTDPF